ncbi:MAG TPA: PmoA family protein [Cyclobacteriaceae bacterium]|jgi:hypothetical protein|nr:PmoA family protein [Cyclobacteriaceae bacterium]
MIKTSLLTFLLFCGVTLFAQDDSEFKFSDHLDQKRIDLFYNGTLLTSYDYADSIKKPVLFPLNTVSGITVTRGFPIAPRPGERIDHPHHIGMWLNYEYVNNIDFWNNSTAIPYKDRNHYGTIVHDGVVKTEADKTHATLEVTARWINHQDQILLREETQYSFHVKDDNFIIDRTTTLIAYSGDVSFKDVKDGLLGIRVARELELPSTEAITFLDNKGNPTTVAAINNDNVTGEYLSSEGITGNNVWSTRGRWVRLDGIKDDQAICITIIDHPKNIGYPAYWHARGYGLFAVNPLGQEVFSKGKTKLNFGLKKDQSVTFRYRVVIHEGDELFPKEIDELATEFANKD